MRIPLSMLNREFGQDSAQRHSGEAFGTPPSRMAFGRRGNARSMPGTHGMLVAAHLLHCSKNAYVQIIEKEGPKTTIFIIQALRFIRTIWTEARQLEAESLRQYPYLLGE